MSAYIKNRCRAAWTRVLNRLRNNAAASRGDQEEETDWLGIG